MVAFRWVIYSALSMLGFAWRSQLTFMAAITKINHYANYHTNITVVKPAIAPTEINTFKKLLCDGSQWGISLQYKSQPSPDGIAQAFILGEEFIANEPVALVLGDNIFYGDGLAELLQDAAKQTSGATIFGYYVRDPERYGVIEFDHGGKVISIEEKPASPKSHYAAIGLYFYDHQVVEIAKMLKPSGRGELEITDLNHIYLEQNNLYVRKLSRGFAWLDTGTHESLLEAAIFIQVLEHRQGLKIGCPEEVAWRMGYIGLAELRQLAQPLLKSSYGKYLMEISNDAN